MNPCSTCHIEEFRLSPRDIADKFGIPHDDQANITASVSNGLVYLVVRTDTYGEKS